MTSKLDPQELERLSKAATAPGALIADKGAFLVALETAYRTGQLVPAQPSGDVVEAVALAIDGENTQGVTLPSTMHIDWVRDMRMAQATAAITAYEAVSGVAKMREALRPFARIADQENRTPSGSSVLVNIDRCRDARAALGEKP